MCAFVPIFLKTMAQCQFWDILAMVYSIRLDLVTSLNVIIKMSDNNGSRIKRKIFVRYRCWMDLKSWYVRCVRGHMIMISDQGWDCCIIPDQLWRSLPRIWLQNSQVLTIIGGHPDYEIHCGHYSVLYKYCHMPAGWGPQQTTRATDSDKTQGQGTFGPFTELN